LVNNKIIGVSAIKFVFEVRRLNHEEMLELINHRYSLWGIKKPIISLEKVIF